MPIAHNPKTGETLFLDGEGQWQKAQVAENPQTKERLAFDGKDWTAIPAAKPSKGILQHVDDAVRSIASGVTLGWADELAAKADEVTGRGGTYEENLRRERERDSEISPAIKIPGEVVGAVGGTLAALPAAVGTLGWRGSAALGGLMGGVGGAGNAEEGERLKGAAVGTGIGLGVGAVTPAILKGAKAVGTRVMESGLPDAHVARDLGRAVLRDEDTPQALVQRAQELKSIRPDATVADAGGENVKGLVERVAQTPGAGRTVVIPNLTDRQKGQMARIANDFRGLTGTHRSAIQAITETMEQRAADAKPLYEKAYAYDLAKHDEPVNAFLAEVQNGWGKSILNSASLKKTLQTEYGITETPGPQHLMAVIDAWKKAADDIIREDPGSNKSRVLRQMLNRVIPLVDDVNPAYKEARNAWAGPSKYLESIDFGRNIFRNNMSADEFATGFASLSAAEQEAARIGAVSSMVAKMGGDAAKLGDMTKYFRSPEMRQKIATILPDDAAREAFAKRFEYEIGSSEMTGRALGNSATARRLAEKEDAQNVMGDLVKDAVQDLRTGGLTAAAMQALKTVPKAIRDTLRSKSDHVLAELLTDPDGLKRLEAAVARIQKRQAPVSGRTRTGVIAAANELSN